jgi:hypothetical protein
MGLNTKTIHELRGIAQSFQIPDIFAKDAKQLIQAIELKQQDMVPKPEIVPDKPAYDARLMDKPPAKRGSEEEILDLLAVHIKRGLHVTFPEPEQWHMQFGKKEDTGTCRQKLVNILRCADRLLK